MSTKAKESRLAMAIGIWITAIGVSIFVLLLSKWHHIGSLHDSPLNLLITFAVGLVVTLLGIWLIRRSFSMPASVDVEDEIAMESERD